MPMLFHTTGKFWLHQVLFGKDAQRAWAIYAESEDELNALKAYYLLIVMGSMDTELPGYTCNAVIGECDYNRLIGIGARFSVYPIAATEASGRTTAAGKIDRRTVEGRKITEARKQRQTHL